MDDTEEKVVIEFAINATPSQFGHLAELLTHKLRPKHNCFLFPVEFPVDFRRNPTEVTAVKVRLGGPNARQQDEFAYVSALSAPHGRSTVYLEAEKRHWNELKPYWQLLHEEMRRQKWLSESKESADKSKTVRISKHDLKLIALANQKPRLSYEVIGDRLHMSEDQVKKRLSVLRGACGPEFVPLRRSPTKKKK